MSTDTNPEPKGLRVRALGFTGAGGVLVGLMVAVLLVFGVGAAGADPPACTVTWTGGAGDGQWGSADNWSTDSVPSSTDVVCIDSGQSVSIASGAAQAAVILADGATVSVSGGSLQLFDSSDGSTIGDLSLSGGALTSPGSLTLTDSLSWTGGTLAGAGTTELASDATGTVTPTSGAPAIVLDGQQLANAGSLTFDCESGTDPTGTYGLIQGEDNAQLDNTGTLTMENPDGNPYAAGFVNGCEFQEADSTADVLDNSGTLQLVGSDSELSLGWEFANDDDATLTGGGVILYGGEPEGGTIGGDWSGTALSLEAGGDYQFSDSSTPGDYVEVDQSPESYGPSDVDFTEWLAGNATAPGMSAGAVSWPDTGIVADGNVSLGDTSGETSLWNLITVPSQSGGSVPDVSLTEPSTDPSDSVAVDGQLVLNGEQTSDLTLAGDINMPDTSMYVDYGQVSETGTGAFDGIYLEPDPEQDQSVVYDQQGDVTTQTLIGNYPDPRTSEISGDGTTTVTNLLAEPLWLDAQTIDNEGTYYLDAQTLGSDGAEIDNNGTIYSGSASLATPPSLKPAKLVNEPDGTMTGNPGDLTVVNWDFDNEGTIYAQYYDFLGSVQGSLAPPASSEYGGNDPATPGRTVCESGDPVDCASGDQIEQETDLSLGGLGGPLQLVRTYNSQLAASQITPGMFGFGWTSEFDAHLLVNTDAALVVQGDGSTVGFTAGSGGSWVPDQDVEATLTTNDDGTYSYELPDLEVLTFDSAGDLVSETNRAGNATTLSYNDSGQLTTVTGASGRQLTFTYNSEGLVASVEDPAGLIVSYGYDAADELTSVSDSAGPATTRWQYAYDGYHELTSLTDANGNTTNIDYEAMQVVSQTDALGRTRTWAYQPGETVITSPAGNTTQELFDEDGNPIAITTGYGTPQQTTKTIQYDSSDEETALTDGNGNTTEYTYDSAGDLTSATDADGRETQWTYDDDRDVLTQTLPSGLETSYAYNGQKLLTSETTGSVSASYAYNSSGEMTSYTDPNGNSTNYTYDTEGDLASVTDPEGNETTYAYDDDGRPTSTVAPAGNVTGGDPLDHTTTYSYDALGDLLSETDPLAHTTSWSYDPDQNVLSETDPDGNTTGYSYDADNELTTVTRADSTTLGNGYDSDGNLISQTNGAGNTTTYTYDPLDQLESVTDPLNNTTSYAYDLAGNLTSVTDPDGRTTSYGYDPANELVSIDYSDGQTPDVTYTYNADGLRTSMSDGTGTTSYSYDSLDRLESETNGDGQTVSYGYDPDGNVTSLGYPNGQTVTRTFDADERLESVSDWLGNTTTFSYDPDSNLQSTTFPSSTGDVDSYGYDNDDQLTSTQIAQGSSTLASLNYTRDPDGLVTNETQTGLPGAGSTDYAYTPLLQLASAGTSDYSYDSADNMTELAGSTGDEYNADDELSSSPAEAFSYDALGERIAGQPAGQPATSYGYDQAQDLTQVQGSLAGSLAAGDDHSLAVGSDGYVYAWGQNIDGQLGNGTTTNADTPQKIDSLSSAVAVAAGSAHSLALKSDGTVWAWGSNQYGQLGNGSTTNSSTPVQVDDLSDVTAISAGAGGSHSLALKSDGTVWAWGYNAYGQLGNGTKTSSDTPVQVSGLSGVVAIAAGADHSLALKSDGTVWAWGFNNDGQLGNTSVSSTSSTPVQVSGLSDVIAIASGGNTSLALKSDGTVWAWGQNNYGQVGNGTTTMQATPVQVSGLTGVTAIAEGGHHSIALKSNGTVWTWGYNYYGQLGNGTKTNATTPVQMSDTSNATAIAAGGYHSLIAGDTGGTTATGWNNYGQLGNGTTTSSTTPVATSSLTIRGQTTTSYTYNGDGLQVSRTAGGVTQHFAWDQSSGTPLMLTDGSTNYIYDANGLPLEQIDSSGNVLYYHHDQLGSTRLLTDSTGATAATFTYTPYGTLASSTGSAATPLGYAGEYTDPTTGLQYDQARWYDPQTGQFMSDDPLEALTEQPYSYAGDDPINQTDPSGLDETVPVGVGPYAGQSEATAGARLSAYCQQHPADYGHGMCGGNISLTTVGLVLSGVSLATGIGAVAGAGAALGEGALGVISVTSGVAGAGVDFHGCLKGSGIDCVGAVAGGLGAGLGGVGLATTGAVKAGATAIGLTFGGIGLLGDTAAAAKAATFEDLCGDA
jgi:RHS repeat-associated protein